jgi:hypothetical protein
MIILDYNQMAIANLMANIGSNPNAEVTEDLVRHMILSSLLFYKRKFHQDYGQIVLACDDRRYWRRNIFPYYKANRKSMREKSKFDWGEIFRILELVREEIRDYFPYILIRVENAEADDVIGSLVMRSQDKDLVQTGLYTSPEPIVICSSDKDFLQLQKYENVRQWSPMKKKFITHDDPELYLKEHIMRGDSGDGVPNFLSPDHVFVTDGIRQTPIRKKKLEEWLNKEIEEFGDAEMIKNYHRNEELISLEKVPQKIQDDVSEAFEKGPTGDTSKLFNYFVKKRLKHLMEDITDF